MTTDTQTVPPDEAPAKPGKRRRKQLSEGARAERRLGWLLCAPAVIIMLAVAAYPIGYAIYLSLQRYDLRFPDQAKFIGLGQLRCRADLAVLVAASDHGDHHVVSVAIELVLGMAARHR